MALSLVLFVLGMEGQSMDVAKVRLFSYFVQSRPVVMKAMEIYEDVRILMWMSDKGKSKQSKRDCYSRMS